MPNDDANCEPVTSTVFGITGKIDPVEDVDETPVGSITAVPVNVNDPMLKEEDTPVNETVSSASYPQPLSPQAFAPQPVASKASSFQYACPQVNRPHPD